MDTRKAKLELDEGLPNAYHFHVLQLKATFTSADQLLGWLPLEL